MKKLSIIIISILLIQIIGCKAPATAIQYTQRTLTRDEAVNYIEEMYYQGIWWRDCKDVKVDDFKIKAKFSEVTTASYLGTVSIFPSNGVSTLFFKQVQDIKFEYLTAWQLMQHKLPAEKRYLITISTRDGNYVFNTTTKELSEDFINAVQYFRNQAVKDSAPIE